MKSINRSFLQKALLFLGAISLGWAANAQSTDNNKPADTSRRAMMHRAWAERRGNDSLAKKHDFRRAEGQRGSRPMHRPGGEGMAFGRGDRIHYTPEQRQQLMAINKEYHKKAADLYAKDNSTLKEYKAALVALQKEKRTKLAALITPAQKEQIARRRQHREENAQVMAAARLERLKIHLQLTEDQVSKIKAGQEDLRSQVKALHENDNLLPQQKMEQLKGLMAKRNDIYKSVLTPEQFSKFGQMSERRHFRGGGERGMRRRSGENMGEGGKETSI